MTVMINFHQHIDIFFSVYMEFIPFSTLNFDVESHIKYLKVQGEEDQREPHTRRQNHWNKVANTLLFLFMGGQWLLLQLHWGARSASADSHLLHGGYFLCQTRNHSEEPQVHEPICHSEVHHLQDLRRFDNQHNDCCVCLFMYVCDCMWTEAVKADPVDVDLFFIRQQLWRDDVFKSK